MLHSHELLVPERQVLGRLRVVVRVHDELAVLARYAGDLGTVDGDAAGAVVAAVDNVVGLADAVRGLLRRDGLPRTRQDLRAELHVNNERLGQVLADLEARGLVRRSAQGWHGVTSGAVFVRVGERMCLGNNELPVVHCFDVGVACY